jgi:hypothetical protein
MPVTSGEWQWQHADGKSAAVFAGSKVTVICDLAERTITIGRRGDVVDATAVVVLTSAQSRTFSGRNTGGQIVVTLPAHDAFLDSIAFSRGRLAIDVAGLEAIYPPSWAEVSRVVEDCRAPSAP